MGTAAPARRIPQPRPLPLLGNATDLQVDTPIQSMMRMARALGPLYRLDFPGQSILVTSTRALVNELCDEQRFDKHVNGPLEHLRDFIGDGLFSAHTREPNWARAHRILLPAFGAMAMRGYFDSMLDIADQLVTKWDRQGPKALHDVPDTMTRLTLDTIGLCGFGFRFNSFYAREAHPFVSAMIRCLSEAGERVRRLPLQTRLKVFTRARYERDIAYMNEVVDQVIQERRRDGNPAGAHDLLSLMLEGRDPESGEPLDDVNIRYQVVTFLIAGHETTSGLLSFALNALLEHPEVLRRAREEVNAVFGPDRRHRPTFEEVKRLEYVDRLLRETLRLWPTAPAFSVRPRAETVIGGEYPLGTDAALLVLIPMLHRDPAVWPDPERFDPERFTPEAVAARPANAWKPFGNGQRACIGREFALLEARLVLGMVLHRFDLERPAPYTLKVKETLTFKPDRLQLRARRREPSVVVQAPVVAKSVAGVRAPRAAHGTPLLVLYGSNAGSAETLAQRLAASATTHGYAPTVAPMDAWVGRLPREGGVVVVTASYNGRPPGNARRFCEWLEASEAGALDGVRFAVFGCGSREWAATYQSVPRQVEAQLLRAGASSLLPRGEADASGDFLGDFTVWSEGAWPTLAKAFAVAGGEDSADEGLRLEVKVTGRHAALAQRHGLGVVEVLENRELVDLASPFGRSKRHLRLRLPEGVSYRAGDHLEVLPENAPEEVARAARRFGLAPEDTVELSAQLATHLPLGRELSVGELLARHVELTTPASLRVLRVLAAQTRCPPEKAVLVAWLGADGKGTPRFQAEVLEKRVTPLELLEQLPACELSFSAFLELLPPMKPRRYSISSSPLRSPSECSLTVSVVDARVERNRGVCSNHLARAAVGGRLVAAVRSPTLPFRLPEDIATPVVLIAAGSGIAPFRAFLEERAELQARGAQPGRALLFFGCDHPDVDFLYRDELEAIRQGGVVEVFPAYLRQPDGEVTFVQHRVWRERAQVSDLLGQGARIYVCGDGGRMVPAVRATVQRIHAEASGCGDAEAEAWLRGLEAEQRYLTDAYGS